MKSLFSRKVEKTGTDPLIEALKSKYNLFNPLVIFDVGANVGQSVRRFHSAFMDAHLYSFEPVKQTFQDLQKLAEPLNKVECFNIGFGSSVGSQTINIEEYSWLNSIVVSELKNSINTEEIEVSTIEHFTDSHNIARIDVLKVDTEGYDLEVLKGAKKLLANRKIDFIYTEAGFYPEDKRHTYLPLIIEYLLKYEYHLVFIYEMMGCGSGFHGNALFARKELTKDFNL